MEGLKWFKKLEDKEKLQKNIDNMDLSISNEDTLEEDYNTRRIIGKKEDVDENLVNTLIGGGVVVMPTDTIYGILGNAFLPETVERIYEIRKREKDKPCIILISDFKDLEKFGIIISETQKEEVLKEKDRALTFILDCNSENFTYLHRGANSLAFRVPKNEGLRILLNKTGPLIAPSANKGGEKPASNPEEAKEYFQDNIDLYINGGDVRSSPSRIVRLYNDGTFSIIRE